MVNWLNRQPTVRLILTRLLGLIPLLFAISFIAFASVNVLPGNVVQQLLGLNAYPSAVHALDLKLGLNEAFFPRYFIWLGHVLQGNLGLSLTNSVPVSSELTQRIPVTAEIVAVALLVAWVVAIPVALWAALKPRGLVDRLSLVTSMSGLSTPPFVLALLGIWIFADHLHLVSAIGFVPMSAGFFSNLHSIILPSAVLAFGLCCAYTRILRADLIDQLNGEDYIVTARAKGIGEWAIVVKHAFRNSLFSLVTVAALNLGVLLGGTVILEEIFGIPGVGLLLLNAIGYRDAPTVEAIVLFLGCCVVVANLIGDLMYGLLDPRAR